MLYTVCTFWSVLSTLWMTADHCSLVDIFRLPCVLSDGFFLSTTQYCAIMLALYICVCNGLLGMCVMWIDGLFNQHYVLCYR